MLPIQREIRPTADGSVTIFLPDWDESYHSKHGAIQEAKHVFIESGLYFLNKTEVSILEIGFGTGLNALLTLIEASQKHLKIDYTGVEAFPILSSEVLKLNYTQTLNLPLFEKAFEKMHASTWDEKIVINDHFTLTKLKLLFENITFEDQFDLIYFDAFGYRVQPQLWSEEIFKIMFKAMKSQGVLVTYACRTPIKKAMEAAGFKTEKLPGPPGKREMLRGSKG